jgi:hypothetical protein
MIQNNRDFGPLRRGQINSTIENTVRYLGIDVEDALALAENTEILTSAPRLRRGANLTARGTILPFGTANWNVGLTWDRPLVGPRKSTSLCPSLGTIPKVRSQHQIVLSDYSFIWHQFRTKMTKSVNTPDRTKASPIPSGSGSPKYR